MEFAVVKKLKETLTCETPIGEIVDRFRLTVEELCNDEEFVVFESLFFPYGEKEFYLFSIYTEINRDNRCFHIRVDLKYDVTPVLCALQNLFYSNREKAFWDKIKNTNAFKYIKNENLKPFDLAVIEMEV